MCNNTLGCVNLKQVDEEQKSKNKKVSQSNDFVAAPYATDFSLHELKICEYMIADTKKIDIQLITSNMNKIFKFSPSELAKILGTSTSRIVADANKLAKNITARRIIEQCLDKNNEVLEFTYVPLITLAKYENAMFEFHLNCYILKYFVDLAGNFTEYYLDHLLSMNSPYAIKIYKLLLMYKNKYRNAQCVFTEFCQSS